MISNLGYRGADAESNTFMINKSGRRRHNIGRAVDWIDWADWNKNEIQQRGRRRKFVLFLPPCTSCVPSIRNHWNHRCEQSHKRFRHDIPDIPRGDWVNSLSSLPVYLVRAASIFLESHNKKKKSICLHPDLSNTRIPNCPILSCPILSTKKNGRWNGRLTPLKYFCILESAKHKTTFSPSKSFLRIHLRHNYQN